MENSQPVLDAPRKLRIGRMEIGINLVVQIIVWLALYPELGVMRRLRGPDAPPAPAEEGPRTAGSAP